MAGGTAGKKAKGGQAKASRNDVELARHEAELARVSGRAEWQRIIAWGVSTGITAALCSFPILALESVIEPLAGKETIVEANLVFSVSVAVSVAVNGLQFLKGRAQRSEIKRLREKIDRLEAKLDIGGAQ